MDKPANRQKQAERKEKMKLRTYLEELRDIYREVAPDYIERVEKIKELDEEIEKVKYSKEYTNEGRTKRINIIREKQKMIRGEADQIKADAKAAVNAKLRTIEERFADFYHPSAARVDEKTLLLFDSGVLTKSEQLALIDQNKGNITMLRLLGKRLADSDDSEMASKGRQLLGLKQEPHLDAARQIMDAGNCCLGDGRMTGDRGCRVFLNRMDEMVNPVLYTAPKVSVSMGDDGQNVYTIED